MHTDDDLRKFAESFTTTEDLKEIIQELLDARFAIRHLDEQVKKLAHPEIMIADYDAQSDTTRGEMRGALLGLMARALSEYLDDDRAKNFITMELRDPSSKVGEFEVTIRRALGKTTTQVLGELRMENERLTGELAELRERIHDANMEAAFYD